MNDWKTTAEAGEIIGISETTVRTHIRRGVLPATKRGRQWFILESDAIAYRDRSQKTGRPRKHPITPTDPIEN